MKFQSKFNILFFLLVIFGLGILNLTSSHAEETSQLEQRDLAERPVFSWNNLFSGQFTKDLEEYISDHFAFRSFMAEAGAYLTEFKGLPDKNEATIVQQGGDNTASTSNTGQEVQYLLFNDRAYTLFKYSEPSAELYAETLNRFRAAVDPKVNVYSLIAPTSAEFIEQEKYKELSDSQKVAIDHINELLDPEIGRVDAYGTLAQHTDEEIYFRTDHHWTALGAYYAYVELMEEMGISPVSLSSYAKGTIPDFLGTAYKATLSYKLKANPDTVTYYEPDENYTYTRYSTSNQGKTGKAVDPKYAKVTGGMYSVFLGGDFPWGEIQTENKNGRKIVVVKDSYGNAFIPFLIPHFESVYYIDPRSFTGSMTEFVKEHEITDVLFLNNSTVARSKGIAELLNKQM